MPKERMPVELVRELFSYKKSTGELIWRVAPSWGVKIGDRAGTVHTDETGYVSRQVGYKRRIYVASHLIWAWMTGEWPKRSIDHKNNDALDDRWENLREATQTEQMRNTRRFRTNTTGYKGVYRQEGRKHRDGKDYRWQIMVNGKKIYSPVRFMTAKEAYDAYCAALPRFHGEFANEGAR
jgi:hypothetical protein